MNIQSRIIPPGRVTNNIDIQVKASFGAMAGTVDFFLDSPDPASRLFSCEASETTCSFHFSTRGLSAGCHSLMAVCGQEHQTLAGFEVLASETRSPQLVGGSWISIVHWSDIEAKYWQEQIVRLTESGWRELLRGMKTIGMDTLVIQEVVRNQMYVDQHSIETEGYHGKAFFPSHTFEQFKTACEDPVEVILDEADKLDMHVFLGVGLYAWFDFSAGSLRWHQELTRQLWDRYGRHQSLYGWYISEEVFGTLGKLKRHRHDIIHFFAEYRRFVDAHFPHLPVMLAPNCHGLKRSLSEWPKLLEHLDVLCPFGFHRMPFGDMSGPKAAQLLQRLCDENNCHLWMDMEVFLFENGAFGSALIPRDIEGIVGDLQTYTNFEKIVCYQYPGLMNAPWAQLKPGGPATERLYKHYATYFTQKTADSTVND